MGNSKSIQVRCECGKDWILRDAYHWALCTCGRHVIATEAPSDAHATLVAYLKAKVEERDWHGVSDAANDLRVLEAKREKAR